MNASSELCASLSTFVARVGAADNNPLIAASFFESDGADSDAISFAYLKRR